MGWERGRQLFSGWDRLKYCSVLTRQKWKISIKLAVVGERNQSLPSGKGDYWGPEGQWEWGWGSTAQAGPGTGGGVKWTGAWAGPRPCEVPTFRPGGVGIPKPTSLVGWMRSSLLSERMKTKYPGRFCLTSPAPLVDLQHHLAPAPSTWGS